MAVTPTRRRRLVLGLAMATVTAAGLSAGGAWWLLWRTRPVPPLDPAWTAIVTVLAGDGVAGTRDGAAMDARFSDPFGVAVKTDGAVVVADAGETPRIRQVAPDGRVSALAGSVRGFMDGPASSARFDTPSGLAVGPDGAIYVADTGNNAIRRIGPDGVVSTLAGGGPTEHSNGSAARFNGPLGVAVHPSGDVIVADTYNDRILAIAPDGRVRSVTGTGRVGIWDGPAAEARFDTPAGVATDDAGNIYVADTGNNVVRVIEPDGRVSTVTPLPPSGLFRPTGIAVGAGNVLFVTDERGQIVELRPGISARVLAGSSAGFADGDGRAARFRAPAGIAVIGEASLVVVDRRNSLVRRIEARGHAPVRLPTSPRVAPQFNAEAFVRTPLLWPVHPQEGPFEITGTMGEMRGGEGEARFHAGLDVRAEQGTVVRAVRDGVVSDPVATSDFDTLNEALRIGPIVYVHQRIGRSRTRLFDDASLAPAYDERDKLVRVRIKRGSRYAVGEALGTANAFNHVHLNVGWPREEVNPLLSRLVQFADSVQPTIQARGIHLLDESGTELKTRVRGRLLVAGRVRIVVDAWDQVDGNRPQRRLGLYRLGYQILTSDGRGTPGFEQAQETIRFDRLFPDDHAVRLAYAPGSGIPFFGGRRTRFLYEITNEVRNGVARASTWNAGALPAGNYTLRILATDFSGNVAIGNRDLAVTVNGGAESRQSAADRR